MMNINKFIRRFLEPRVLNLETLQKKLLQARCRRCGVGYVTTFMKCVVTLKIDSRSCHILYAMYKNKFLNSGLYVEKRARTLKGIHINNPNFMHVFKKIRKKIRYVIFLKIIKLFIFNDHQSQRN